MCNKFRGFSLEGLQANVDEGEREKFIAHCLLVLTLLMIYGGGGNKLSKQRSRKKVSVIAFLAHLPAGLWPRLLVKLDLRFSFSLQCVEESREVAGESLKVEEIIR